MSDETAPIIIKRIKKVAGGHHGGAWKIAYADFVTAMMAFFLLMWLIGSTTKGDLEGIAEYFQTPLKVALRRRLRQRVTRRRVIQGGGNDLSRSAGKCRRTRPSPSARPSTCRPRTRSSRGARRERLEALKARFDEAIDANPKLTQFKNQIRLEITAEGLQIPVIDEQNRPMFDSGSAPLKDYTREIMREIGGAAERRRQRISLAGHTDAVPYAGGERGYSNWELSADRANASRRELVAGGIDDDKILRVVGLGSSLPLDEAEPAQPDESPHQPRRAERQGRETDPRDPRAGARAGRGCPRRFARDRHGADARGASPASGGGQAVAGRAPLSAAGSCSHSGRGRRRIDDEGPADALSTWITMSAATVIPR